MIGFIRSVLFLCTYPDCCSYVSVERPGTRLYIHFGGVLPIRSATLPNRIPNHYSASPCLFSISLSLLHCLHIRTRTHPYTYPCTHAHTVCLVSGCKSVRGWVRGTRHLQVRFLDSHNMISCAPPIDTNVCRFESTRASFLLNQSCLSQCIIATLPFQLERKGRSKTN